MEDTIAAIATAYGEGGIGIIRISGAESKSILDEIFKAKSLEDITLIDNRRLYYGNIVDNEKNSIIDEVMAVYMKAPNTYTREDVVEIFCHGSVVALRNILALVLRKGARLAENGEFTKRAFLNGRLDLSQAEAVIDMIKAKTDKSFEVAMQQMEGSLSEKIRNIRKLQMDLLVDVTVNLDYPDEDIEELTYDALIKSTKQISDEIEAVLLTADTGRIIREGLKVSIIGKPNVGKSSLLNALLKESRAIVTEIPGTTRDTIEESININGVPIIITDTAGIRQTKDEIEKIGIEKSKESFNRADLVIFIIDASKPLEKEDIEIMEKLADKKAIIMLNKSDLGQIVKDEEILINLNQANIIKTSIKSGQGIKELEEKIVELVYGGAVKQEDSLMVTNVRHKNLLIQAKEAISEARQMAENREALDFIEVDIRRSWELLGEIIGESVTEDIIDQVFARFCLGK